VAGGLSGLLLTGLGYLSLDFYKKGKLCKPATVASMVMSLVLTIVMHRRFQKTGTVFPSFVFMLMSGLMFVFYVWNLLCGPLPKKRAYKA
jgi:low temperature requirement protein LtrA